MVLVLEFINDDCDILIFEFKVVIECDLVIGWVGFVWDVI